MTAALYARVSTNDERQHLANQLDELRRYADRAGWTIGPTYTDQITGASDRRPGLDSMMAAASRREFGVVLVWDLSRLTRKGPASAFGYIQRLKDSGVDFCSYREEYFRTAGIAGPMLIAVAAFLAQQERETMSARVKAGLDRVRNQGTTLGRPAVKISENTRKEILALYGQGKGLRYIGSQFGLGKNVVSKVVNMEI